MVISPICRQNITVLVNAFIAAHNGKYNAATVSRRAHSDPVCLPNLIAGKGSISLRKYDSSVKYLTNAAHWPEGAKIPEIVPVFDATKGKRPKAKPKRA